jgi:dGTP triphosphohydrolase
MPYSVDSDENKENPASPSRYMTINEQLMYKLAALDASMQSGFRRLDEKMDRFQTDLHQSQIETNDRINELDKEFTEAIAFRRITTEAVSQRVSELEIWSKVLMARIAVGITVLALLWTVFAPTVQHWIGVR